MAFVKAIPKSAVPPGSGKCVELQGRRIGIFNVDGRYCALDDTCSHEEASLSEGGVSVAGGRCIVECPRHGARFDLKTGAVLSLPAVKPVRAYNVRESGDEIEVEI